MNTITWELFQNIFKYRVLSYKEIAFYLSSRNTLVCYSLLSNELNWLNKSEVYDL